jgi:creatinine amidohydrolase
MGFPGTITISAELMTGTVEAYIRCLAVAGFKELILTSSHGGNFNPLHAALPRMAAVAASAGVALTAVLDLTAWIAALNAALVDRGVRQGDVPAIQADLIETSLMLRLDPRVVHMERAEVGILSNFDVEEMFTHGLKRMTANGILGDPRGASDVLGEEIFQALEQYLVDAVEKARQP